MPIKPISVHTVCFYKGQFKRDSSSWTCAGGRLIKHTVCSGGQSRQSLTRRSLSSSSAQRCVERGCPRRRVAPPAQAAAAPLQRHDLRPHGRLSPRQRLLHRRGRLRWRVWGQAVEEGQRRSGAVDAGQGGATGGKENTLNTIFRLGKERRFGVTVFSKQYRVSHLVADLGWVGLDLGYSTTLQ